MSDVGQLGLIFASNLCFTTCEMSAYKRLKLVELQRECDDRGIRYRGCNKKRLIELLHDFDEAVAQNDAVTADDVNSEQVSDVESERDDNEVTFGRPVSRQSYTAVSYTHLTLPTKRIV